MGGAQSSSQQAQAGQWSVSLAFAGAYSHAEHDVSPDQYEPDTLNPGGVQAQRHVLDFNLFIAQLSGTYGLTDWLTLGLELPIRATTVSADFLNTVGDDIPQFQSIHHRDETLTGLADPTVNTQWYLPLDKLAPILSASVTLGLSLPVGRTEPDPFLLGKLGKRHQHIFYGTGTMDPLAALRVQADLGAVSLQLTSRTRTSLYRNSEGYLGPFMVEAGLKGRSSLGLENWVFVLGPEMFHETPASWSDRTAENSGRTELLIAVGVAHRFASGVSLMASAKTPVVTRSRGGQLEIPFLGSLGVSYSPPAEPTATPDSHAQTGGHAP
ncbi:MAG: hypothetical protein VYE15_04995 [Myxococcota bacterium]|nr:hypothetical protein [Myxococcota bacterium]